MKAYRIVCYTLCSLLCIISILPVWAGGYGDEEQGWAAMPEPLSVAPVQIIEAPCKCVCADTPEAMEEPTGFVIPTPNLNERELPLPPDLFWDRFYGGNGGNASPN